MSWAPKPSSDGFRYYGKWAGNPAGQREDKLRCIEVVTDRYKSRQCLRERKCGPDGLYCKQHDPIKIAERAAKKRAAWDAKWEADRMRLRAPEAYRQALESIAAGHNDPRGLAIETLACFAQKTAARTEQVLNGDVRTAAQK
jgi:hypothetical protein